MRVYIDSALCKSCGLCIKNCPKNVFEMTSRANAKGYSYVQAAREQDCIGCKLCEKTCPDFVIHVE